MRSDSFVTEREAQRILTPREEDVLRLISYGQCNKEIAHFLEISERTVKFHMSNLLAKFGVTSRLELLAVLSRPSAAALLLCCLSGYLYFSTVVS